ncbi:MAG TPA: hypothetical protein DDW30_00445 [Clostridiales bacterium]|nr:hypothetical protein [Clostridiales bacterium]
MSTTDKKANAADGAVLLPDLLDLPAKQARFARIYRDAMLERREDLRDGIGLLGEKWQHQIIKRYLTEDPSEHEVKLAGTRFVSDVRVGNAIYEVQTGSFAPMKRKLERYLADPSLTVTVVHPLPAVRHLSWMDPATGELGKSRRVAGKRDPVLLLPALYPLIPLLSHVGTGRLSFRLLLLEVEDFKLLDGRSRDRKHGATRLERIPTGLLDDLLFVSPADFAALLPPELPSPLTVAMLSRATGLQGLDAYSAARALAALGILTPAAPISRAMAFEVVRG